MSLLKSAATVSVFTLLSRITGLIRDMLIARYFGVSAATDAFYVAFRIPNMLRRLFAEGAFSQAFVPMLSQVKEQQPEGEQKTFISDVFSLLGCAVFIASLLGIAFAPVVVWLIASGFKNNPETFDLAVFLTRYMFPYIIFNNTAQIMEPDISKQNGYVHILNAVLDPPMSSVWELMEENGGYTRIMALFEEYGLDAYLKDSTVTVLAEPDFVIERSGVNLDTISNMEDWLKYHILPERAFTTELDGRLVQTLYEGDGITFNFLSTGGDMEIMYCNQRFPFCNQSGYESNQLALNGLLQPLDSVLQIVEHTPGTVRMNLYGGTNTFRGYEQNVFADSPARVIENYSYQSYHQGRYYPCCEFVPYQVGDEFWFTIPDVVPGSYQVRVIYYADSAPSMSMLYNGSVITSDIDFMSATGTFEEWTEMDYKDCGRIEVLETGDVTLHFQLADVITLNLILDMVELRP